MTARYWVLVSDELIETVEWPDWSQQRQAAARTHG